LRYLNLGSCEFLQSLPYKISSLTSLQYLNIHRCSSLFTKGASKKLASINNLRSLRKLKILIMQNNGATIHDGTLGNMTEMESMELTLTRMASLPREMINMPKLRELRLQCPHLVKMDFKFCEFQNLSHLALVGCEMLEELPSLNELKNLKQLEISKCFNLAKFPEGFGEIEAFPKLEIFSLAWLDKLEELPLVKAETMPSLQILSIVECKALKILPENYLTLKSLRKIRIYGCLIMFQNLEKFKQIEVVTMSTTDTKEIIKKYLQVHEKIEGWLYGEYWSNELFVLLRSLIH